MTDDIVALLRELRFDGTTSALQRRKTRLAAADALTRLSEENERYRRALEIIAGQPQHVLEAMQARAALENIGP